ncbi:MAG: ABC transporter ATP-binding protein [Trueperaceae bacterium]|nr:ABC transporter ATP-binding protein [Trueperaceae bacterium]
MRPFGFEVQDLGVRFGATRALDGVGFRVEPGTICGLLGRNGSGKTTLLSTVAAFRRPTSGRVLVDGEPPFENARVMAGICLVREGGDVLDDRVDAALRYASRTRAGWDEAFARRLVDLFELPRKASVSALSRGQRSALGAAIGLASRAPLTLFDEVYLGMDAPTRYAFYDELLADYMAHPRTVVLSSHLIEEIERLFEHVVILDRGRLLVADAADALAAQGVTVTGPADRVDAFVAGTTVLRRQVLGRTAAVTLHGHLDDAGRRRAGELGLTLGSVSLQDLFVHLTEPGRDAA